MLLKKTKKSMPLEELPCGGLFLYNETLCLKTKYRTSNGAIEAFIVGSGEMFWGGVSTPEEQRQVMVRRVKLLKG